MTIRHTPGRRISDRGIIDVLHRQYFIVRMYVAISVLLSVFSIFFEITSPQTELPWFMFLAAVVVCAFGIIDAFINDFLPNKYIFKHTYMYRHLIYMSMALISFSLSAGLLHEYGGSFLVGRLWLDGLIATIVAILDLFARHRENSWRSGTH